jgi:cytoskeletal protein RodZ
MIDFLLVVLAFLGGLALGWWINRTDRQRARSVDVKNTLFGLGTKKN